MLKLPFTRFTKSTGLAAILAFSYTLPLPAQAEDRETGFYVTDTESSFEDAETDLSNAIINEGLVIDYTGHVGDMLTRTSDAVGMNSPYKNAIYMQFCSSKHTHEAVAADPRNIAICPYVVFIYEMADGSGVKIGYRRPIGVEGSASTKALAGVDELLKNIVSEASEGF